MKNIIEKLTQEDIELIIKALDNIGHSCFLNGISSAQSLAINQRINQIKKYCCSTVN